MSAWLDLRHGIFALGSSYVAEKRLALRIRLAHRVMRLAVHLSLALPQDPGESDSLAVSERTTDAWDVLPTYGSTSPIASLVATPSQALLSSSVTETHYRFRPYADALHQPYRPECVETRYLINRMVLAMQLLEHQPPRYERAIVRLLVDLLFAVGVDRVEDALLDEVRRSATSSPMNLQQ